MQPHCDGGAYVAGDWVPIEECLNRFLCKDKETSGSKHTNPRCAKCPRSRSRNSASRSDGSYDVVIIGAGAIGCCIARELSRTNAKVLLLEGADDVTQGATKGNSGIVHAGFDDKPGSVRAKFCPSGCRMFPQLDEELHFGFQKNTSLVVAKGPEDEETLKKLLKQGEVNGVRNLRIIDQQELRRREPNIHPEATKALLAEDAGTIIPYEYCIALAENAVDNGVEIRLRRVVTGIQKFGDGFIIHANHWEPSSYSRSSTGLFTIVAIVAALALFAATFAGLGLLVQIPLAAILGFALSRRKASAGTATVTYASSKGTIFHGPTEVEEIRADFIVNAAGCGSDKIAAMVGDTSFQINERYGEYILLHKKEGKSCSSTLFPCPGPKGKGVLVQNTVWGNLILGPTARDTLAVDPQTGKLAPNLATLNEGSDSIMRYIFQKCRELVPNFKAREVIHTFTGGRAKSTRGDWIIEPCPTAPRLIHAAGIDSPGLAASPAIALEVIRLLRIAGATVAETVNPSFNPIRAPIVIPKRGMKDALGNSLKMGPPGKVTNPYENVVCKCEKVTEAEIVEALNRSIPIDSTQAIRRRTRAGMGHCQADPSNYCCEDRVAAIIAREKGLKVDQVPRRPWPASSLMPRRFFTEADKDWVESLSH